MKYYVGKWLNQRLAAKDAKNTIRAENANSVY